MHDILLPLILNKCCYGLWFGKKKHSDSLYGKKLKLKNKNVSRSWVFKVFEALRVFAITVLTLPCCELHAVVSSNDIAENFISLPKWYFTSWSVYRQHEHNILDAFTGITFCIGLDEQRMPVIGRDYFCNFVRNVEPVRWICFILTDSKE